MTPGKIAVLCPTRGRPDEFRWLRDSVAKTSDADVLAYVDEDQAELYGPEICDSDNTTVGGRIGPVASANLMARKYPDYSAYGLVTDDSMLATPGWDRWADDALNRFPGRLCVLSPSHNNGTHVDMPFVSREWIDLVGWYACPSTFHYAWPIITGLIGEMTAIVHAPRDKFSLEHNYVEGTNAGIRDRDYRAFFSYVSSFLPETVDKIRKQMVKAARLDAA